MTAPPCGPQLLTFWIGNAGGLWLNLTLPDTDYTTSVDQGRITHALISGGSAVQRVAKSRRQSQFAFSQQTADVLDQIVSLAYGLLGPGPYSFIDPTWRNQLPGHVSAAGKLAQNSTGYQPTSGTVAYSSAVAPPTAAPLSGVQAWAVAAVNGTLGTNQSIVAQNETSAPPPLPAIPMTFGVWLKSSAATTITAIAQCCNSAGGSTGTVTLGTWSVTSTWTRFAATLAAASVPATTASVSLTIKSSIATTVDIAAQDMQYVAASVGTAASSLPAWVHGLGVPKMLISGPQNANHGGRLYRRTSSLTLVEAA